MQIVGFSSCLQELLKKAGRAILSSQGSTDLTIESQTNKANILDWLPDGQGLLISISKLSTFGKGVAKMALEGMLLLPRMQTRGG